MLAVLLLGGVVMLATGGGAALPTATPLRVLTDPAAPLPAPASVSPIPAPTRPPATLRPPVERTAPPSEVPSDSPTAPTETPLSCASSSVPTEWVNLSGAERERRVRRNETWCIHQVVIVPDPNFGVGTIRLLIDGETLVEIEHSASSSLSEYPRTFLPARLVPSGADVEYAMKCPGDGLCNAVIQVGFEVLHRP